MHTIQSEPVPPPPLLGICQILTHFKGRCQFRIQVGRVVMFFANIGPVEYIGRSGN